MSLTYRSLEARLGTRRRPEIEASTKIQEMIFVGFTEGSKTIRYWDKEHRSIKVTRNFVFAAEDTQEIVELPGLTSKGEQENSPIVVEAKTQSDDDQEEEEVGIAKKHTLTNATSQEASRLSKTCKS